MPHTIDISQERIDLGEDEVPGSDAEFHGLLVTYMDDQLNECVNLAVKRKSRVRYRCMDTFANFLAFGTSGGAIYLYKLKSMTHASCSLATIIACDQGSIEVIRFLPNAQTDDLLIAIGTSRGSMVVFRLYQLPGDPNPTHGELYRAESFTGGAAIKMIECDLDLLDPSCSFTKVYICDTDNRLYCLESNYIYNSSQMLRLKFYVNNYTPTLIFSVTDSNINQISVHRSQVLISTDETTRLFNDNSNQLHVIGKKKRRGGFYGACFFNPTFKPSQILPVNNGNPNFRSSQNLASAYSSNNSLADLENLLIFVARPVFRLWQVNFKRTVMFTHQFKSLIETSSCNNLIELHNDPLEFAKEDDPKSIISSLEKKIDGIRESEGDHFKKIVPIYSSALGNLLLSYTQHEIYVVDPIGAKLISRYCQADPIIQVCCNENEFFVWSSSNENVGIANNKDTATDASHQRGQFKVQRLVLLAPTQFVLELHRLHRYLTIMAFISRFESLFRKIMVLPLSSLGIITTEGGLLRNVLMNAWDTYETQIRGNNPDDDTDKDESRFKRMIDEIIEESEQLKHSLENLTDSRFFLNMTSENIERLCSEPYTSLVSLEISLANLHSNRVIHFSKKALNRHRSVANLSQSIKNLNKLKQTAKSNFDLRGQSQQVTELNCEEASPQQKTTDSKVVVERQRPRRAKKLTLPPQITQPLVSTESESSAESQNESYKGTVISSIQEPEVYERNDIHIGSSMNGESRNFVGENLIHDDQTADPPTAEFDAKRDEDEFSLNLAHLFDQTMMRPDVDIRELVRRLLEHPTLLDNSKIPASFYLQIIRFAVATANQSPIVRARLKALVDSTGWSENSPAFTPHY